MSNKEPQNYEGVTSTFDIPCSTFCGSKKVRRVEPAPPFTDDFCSFFLVVKKAGRSLPPRPVKVKSKD
jgi:hypothetical protein